MKLRRIDLLWPPRACQPFAVALALVPFQDHAETPSTTPPPPDLSQLSLSELLDVRYETVFAASKRKQETWEAPASVTIVHRNTIETFGYRTLADALDGTSGTYITSERVYAFLGVRGFSPPGDYNGRVLLLIDGHRANDNVYDSAMLGTEGQIDIDLVERLEIIRGPSSSIYGSSAFFGILNVVPRRGADLQGVEASGEAGSFETYKARATAGYRLNSGVEFLVSATYFSSRGEPEIYLPDRDIPGASSGVAHDLDGYHGYNLFASASYLDFTLTAAASSRDKSLPDAGTDTAFDDPRGLSRDTTHFVDLKFNHTFEDETRLTARAGYHDTGYFGWYPMAADLPPTDPSATPSTVVNRDEVRGSWWSTELSGDHTFFDQLTVSLGADFRYNFRQDQANFDEGASGDIYGDVREASSVTGVFGQVDWTARDNLIVNAGLRYDDSSTASSHLSPRAGVMTRPWESTSLKFLYGSAFRAPNAYEYGFYSSYFTGNPDLNPEVVQSFEIAAEHDFGSGFVVGPSLFYNRVEDLIVLDNSGPILTTRNAEATHAFGGEIRAEYRWTHQGLVRASYSYQKAEEIEGGQPLFNAPEHLAKLQVRLPLWKEKLFLSPEIHYVDSILGTQGAIDAFWATQVTLFARDLFPGLDASVSVYNVLDQDIEHPVSDEYPLASMPQPGATFRFKLTYRF
ncbi:MAG: TonB-dependent receptor [Verrucomicrobiales bacterium]|nr:TonB-dependent receptor [Verrucomicrobiales bacterium]